MAMMTDLQTSGEVTWEDRLRRGTSRGRLTLNPEYQELKFRLHRRLLDKINLEALASIENEKVRLEVRNALMSLMDEESTLLSSLERQQICDEVLDEVFGLGPLEPLLQDPTISDILVNTHRQVYIERKGQLESVVAWIGAEMEFALSQAVASGDAFEHRPSECGHCVQNFLADRDFRDLPGEAAGFELGADHALPTADLRFYPAALVVPCGRLPGHTAIAADLGNMAIPNGWTPRRLRTDHCVLWRRYNHIQGLPIPFPQQIPCRRPIIGAVSQKARDRGIQLIQKPGQGGAVSSVIVSQIGANNRTAGQVQSEVEFAPAAAYYLDFMLLCEPFPLAEDLEAGTVHHQMDRHRSCLPHHLSDAHPVCATRQRGVIRYPYIQPHERADGSHKSLRLPQRKPIRRAQRQACLDRQIRVSALTTP